MDWAGVQHIQEGSGEQGKMEETGYKVICSAPTTPAVKGLMMMIIVNITEQMDSLRQTKNTKRWSMKGGYGWASENSKVLL